MKVVHADGSISKTGGRVVKNVTGYDLAKLYTGSLGTLALIAEISFKVRPRFGKTATAVVEPNSLAESRELLGKLRKSPLQPVSCELVGPRHAVWIRFEEHPRAVDWQIANLPPAAWKVVEGDEEIAAWQTLRNHYFALEPIVIRVMGTPTTVVDVIEKYKPSAWIAHVANGILLMAVPGPEAVLGVRKDLPTIVERARLDVRRRLATFGLHGTPKRLMRDMKRAFDPMGRLNPGRHVDGEE